MTQIHTHTNDYQGHTISDDSWAVEQDGLIVTTWNFHIPLNAFSPLAMHSFNCLNHVSSAFWYLDRGNAISSEITAFDRPFIMRENFCLANLCFNIKINWKLPSHFALKMCMLRNGKLKFSVIQVFYVLLKYLRSYSSTVVSNGVIPL